MSLPEDPFGLPDGGGTGTTLVDDPQLQEAEPGDHERFAHYVRKEKIMESALSGSPVRRTAYDCASCLNRRHMSWAWCSLFSVGLADLYVRLCSMGVIRDWRIF